MSESFGLQVGHESSKYIDDLTTQVQLPASTVIQAGSSLVGMTTTIALPLPPSFAIHLGGPEIMRITHDGHFFWHGQEVEGGPAVQTCMLELLEYFRGTKPLPR